MTYFLNQTEDYHRNDINNLGWELTVCNCLEPSHSPVRDVLKTNAPYGYLLLDYLTTRMSVNRLGSVLEVGGGYGYLMRDLLTRFPDTRATMVDIAPAMIKRQQHTLKDFDVTHVESDFFDVDPLVLQEQDMVIMNEIIGDFPTACNLTMEMITTDSSPVDPALKEIGMDVKTGVLAVLEGKPFNVNIGAARAVRRLCSLGIPAVFLSEHSCEAAVTDHMKPYVKLEPTNNPHEIKLIGHSEYTIRFSHLEAIARQYGYTVYRGNYTEFIKLNFSNKINYIFRSNSKKDDHEIIRQFIEDLYMYEYLLLIKDPRKSPRKLTGVY